MSENFTKFVHDISIQRNKETEKAVIGEMQFILIEHGIRTEIILNEKFIVNAVNNATPKKIIVTKDMYPICPKCKNEVKESFHCSASYCSICGQALEREV